MSTASALVLTLALAAPSDVVLLEFTAEWCGPCRVMAPTVARLVSAGYPIRKIDVDRDARTASRFRVNSVPCFVMLVDGHEVDRLTGAVSHEQLVRMYEQASVRTSPAAAPATRHRSSRGDVVRAQSPDDATPAAGTFGAPQSAPSVARFGQPTHVPQSARALPPIASPARNRSAGVDPAAARAAFQSTVRLKVEDPQGHGFGTGTIIDVHGSEALVVTCGHLFRESEGKGRIQVDLFNGDQIRTVPGQLISHNLERDIALVSITPGQPVQAARVAANGQGIAPGASVFSIGCDKGQPPSIRESQVTAVDRYLGPPNIEVAGQPIDGRSGGGLFSGDGRLIGICNAADPADNEGIYAGLPTIHWELDRIGQRRVYEVPAQPLLAQTAVASPSALPPLAPPTAPPHMPDRMVVPTVASQAAPHSQQPNSLGQDTEVICIIRSRRDPQGEQRLLVLDRPSADLLARLRQESQTGAARNSAAPNSAPASIARHPATSPPRRGSDPVIRAQSADR